MNNRISTIAAVLGLALATVLLAPAAQAVTNPADNPHKITVRGDDGNTYVDGQDTLPGFDDEECTYIPGAYYDFDRNRVYYADGQWIPWTEWDRATGYKEWQNSHKDKDTGGSTGGSKDTSSTGGTKSPTKTGTKTTATSGSTKTAGASGSRKTTSAETAKNKSAGTSKTSANTAGTDSAGAVAVTGPSASAVPEVSPTAAEIPGASTGPTLPGATPTAAGVVALAAAQSSEQQANAQASGPTEAIGNPESTAGLLILAGLAIAGAITLSANSVVRRTVRREPRQ